MNVKTLMGWVAIAFVVWWVIEEPAAAAHLVHNIGAFLTSAAHGITDMFGSGKDNGGSGWLIWVPLGVVAVIIVAVGITVIRERVAANREARETKSERDNDVTQ